MKGSDSASLPVRVGLGLTTLVYLVYSSFGIAAPFWWGHHGYHGAIYLLRARMTLRFHMMAPATWTGFDRPPPAALYFHHPIGLHHILTLLVPIFGEHEWLARAVGVLGGLAAQAALYVLVSRFWSRLAALVAVIVFVTLPIVTSFSVLCDAMMLEMACILWALYAYLLLLESPSRRALLHAAAAFALGGLIMWEVYFIGPFLAIHALVYSFTRRGARLNLGRYNALVLYVLVTASACAAMLALHFWMTARWGMLQDFTASYRIRSAPPSAEYVIGRHLTWVTILYGKPPVLLGAVWFALWLSRLATGRARLRDLCPLTFLYVNTLYIYLFAEGSSVHLYRVFMFSGCFVLAAADLATSLHGAVARVAGRGSPRWIPGLAVLAALSLYVVFEAPHAYANLLESRVMMGTHSQTPYSPEQEKMLFAREVMRRTTPADRVIMHLGSLPLRKEFWWYCDRSFDEIHSLQSLQNLAATLHRSVLILDDLNLSPSDRAIYHELMRKHPVIFIDRLTIVDLRSSAPGVTSYGFVPRHPSRRYWWWVSHRYAPLELARRGYLPGLCQALALGVPVARDEEIPAPANFGQWLCYYNLMVARGDPGAAAWVPRELERGLEPQGLYLGGARLGAAGVAGGKLKLVLMAAGPEKGDLRYVLRRAGQPPVIIGRGAMPPPADWRAGYLYLDQVPFAAQAGPMEVGVELWTPGQLRPPFLIPPPEVLARVRLKLGSDGSPK